MANEEEVTIAWTIFNLLNKLSDQLWERYEDGFLDRCMEENEKEYDNKQTLDAEGSVSDPEFGNRIGDRHDGPAER